jgi:hypothetical protein
VFASDDAVLNALTNEYRALRDEIGRLIEHEKGLVDLSFVVLGAVLALIGTLLRQDGANENAARILLFVPVLYLLFALSAAEQTRRLMQIARYIRHDLTPRAEALTDGLELWRWEDYKAAEYRRLPSRGRARVWILERSRWMAMTVPGITALVAFGALVGYEDGATRVILVIDVLILLVQVGVLMRTTEAPGLLTLRSGQQGASNPAPTVETGV